MMMVGVCFIRMKAKDTLVFIDFRLDQFITAIILAFLKLFEDALFDGIGDKAG